METAPEKKPLTKSQERAVTARGNVLVMAGAGTGKTKTLVDRCLHCLENDGVEIDQLLVVTFTEAAAAELRGRLRKKLEEKAEADPSTDLWPKQLARFDLAHIGTLHGFCSKLVGEHFYELGLDPQLSILDEGEARQLANETLDEQFNAHYQGRTEFSPAVQELISVHGGERDENIRKLVLRLHHYSQARPDAAGWLAEQTKRFSTAEPAEWQRWLMTAIAAWRNEWQPALESLKSENFKAAELAGILARLEDNFSRESAAEILGQIAAADATASYGGKALKLRPALGKIFEEAEFLSSLAFIKNDIDPLIEDWNWVRGQMTTLLRLAVEFSEKFSARKRADGVMDFHDLEQYALKLLWDFSTNQPAVIAGQWREKLKFVFVDEYQDINAAQDKIITALSGDGKSANRFLVGDVKQSIYRFRLADPKIFRDYARDWHGRAGETISLSDNFRSREKLLGFTNSLFPLVMRAEIGGVAYDRDAQLQFGSPETRGIFSAKNDSAPRAELLVRFKNDRNKDNESEDDVLAGLDDTQREARLVAWRLKQLFESEPKHEIFDDEEKIFRPVEWRDMAILLRSPRGRSEIFAKEFERAGIPLAVARGGFYESAEILDLISLLELLDNPLQDVPCIAVLRSPFVALSLDELAQIRLTAPEKHFWTALNRFQNLRSDNHSPLTSKIGKFLARFHRWRKMAKQISLSQCLEEILSETYYADWLRAQSRGSQRAANVTSFLDLAQSFDQFQRQGLFRFLKFIEAQQENEVEPEVSAGPVENAVRLMSIHQSKGQEFPIVVLADLSKRFNERDLRGEIIFDEELGLCPKIKPPHAGGRYPSLPHWLAQRRQKRELLGEELRLFYVAITRARDNLILTAGVAEKDWAEKWKKPQPATVQKISSAKCFADWLAIWFSNQTGESDVLSSRIVADDELIDKPETSNRKPEISASGIDGRQLEKLRGRLEWAYPSLAATRRKAKATVTELRRAAEETDDEAEPIFTNSSFEKIRKPKSAIRNNKLSASEIGAAHHKFLEHFELNRTDFSAEADRLVGENRLSADEREALDLDALKNFWNSGLGKDIRAHSQNIRRELPFTARFNPAEISKIIGQPVEPGLKDEFVVVQGVADLAVILPDEIWLVDFKTDEVSSRELPEKVKTYKPQLQLYAAALEKIHSRKVTKRALHFLSARQTVEV